jgi:hypothetical protein
MSSRRLLKSDWAKLGATKDELRVARACLKAVVGNGIFGPHDLDGPLTKHGEHEMQLFDLVCALRGEGLKRQRQQIAREHRIRDQKDQLEYEQRVKNGEFDDEPDE